jgi:hypothetical protein
VEIPASQDRGEKGLQAVSALGTLHRCWHVTRSQQQRAQSSARVYDSPTGAPHWGRTLTRTKRRLVPTCVLLGAFVLCAIVQCTATGPPSQKSTATPQREMPATEAADLVRTSPPQDVVATPTTSQSPPTAVVAPTEMPEQASTPGSEGADLIVAYNPGPGVYLPAIQYLYRVCVPAGGLPTMEELYRDIAFCLGLARMTPGSRCYPCEWGQAMCGSDGCRIPPI